MFDSLLCYLFSKRRRSSNCKFLQQSLSSLYARLMDKHAGIEVEGRRWAHLVSRPCNLVRALLAVPDLVLRCVAPCLLTEAIHHGIEVAIRQSKQVVYVLIDLDICIEVYHLLVLDELRYKRLHK